MMVFGINLADDYLVWGGFLALIAVLLIIDLGIFNRKAHRITVKEALAWTVIWIAVAMAFNVFIYFWHGHDAALEFLTGYLLEKSLSVDNLFVFLILFTYFCVPKENWHRVLFYGIVGAILMRGLFIGVGIAVISAFHWVLYIFGFILIITAVRIVIKKDEEVHPENNPILRFFRKILPVSKEYDGAKFFTRINGKLVATPLFIVLIAIETTDVVFAMDSVPAIFGITLDPFIVFTSNIFAILGLRALFFAIAGVIENIYYLKYGLAIILGFIGVKIFLELVHYEIPIFIALGFVAAVLAVAITASYIKRKYYPSADSGGAVRSADDEGNEDRKHVKNLGEHCSEQSGESTPEKPTE